jgi:uncharacterized membrane protein
MESNILNLFSRYRNKNWVCLSGILLSTVITIIVPFALLGFPGSTNDFEQHFLFAKTFHDAILTGDFFPGWSADNIGFGSVGIRFYPPLMYYLLAITQLLTSSWYDTFWINLFGWMFLGCAGVYWLAKEWLPPFPAMLAGMLYAFMPYHLTQIYQYFLYAEFGACGILPFCFLFITRICRRGKWIDCLLFALSYSLLILTHIPSTIIATLSLTVYVLVLIDRRQFKKNHCATFYRY